VDVPVKTPQSKAGCDTAIALKVDLGHACALLAGYPAELAGTELSFVDGGYLTSSVLARSQGASKLIETPHTSPLLSIYSWR